MRPCFHISILTCGKNKRYYWYQFIGNNYTVKGLDKEKEKRKNQKTKNKKVHTSVMIFKNSIVVSLLTASSSFVNFSFGTEILYPGDKQLNHIINPLPYTYLDKDDLPKEFFWGDVAGKREIEREE